MPDPDVRMGRVHSCEQQTQLVGVAVSQLAKQNMPAQCPRDEERTRASTKANREMKLSDRPAQHFPL